VSGGAKFILCVLAVLAAIVAVPIAMLWHNHVFDEDYSYIARRDVHFIVDSPEVQRLLSEEGAKWVQRPERHTPRHIEFLNAMARVPTEMVPEGSHARVLKTSPSPCGQAPYSDNYAEFMVTTGDKKNHKGWACMSGDFAPALMWP